MLALITGGGGFIGSHLAERLLDMGNAVVAVDDFSTGTLANLFSLHTCKAFKYHIGTILDKRLMAGLIREADIVYHLAASVGVHRILQHTIDSMRRNVMGTEVVLDLASQYAKRVVIASSVEVYGPSPKCPAKETERLTLGGASKGRWSYACSKAINEFMALAYHAERELPVSIVRLSNTVGARQVGDHGMVLPTFISQALREQPLTVYGSGNQSRCFVCVHDVVNGLIACAASSQAIGEIFNIGGTQEITINSLAETVIETLQSSSTVVHVPYFDAYGRGFEDIEHIVPDISKAEHLLGYKPQCNLRSIIHDVANHYKEVQCAFA